MRELQNEFQISAKLMKEIQKNQQRMNELTSKSEKTNSKSEKSELKEISKNTKDCQRKLRRSANNIAILSAQLNVHEVSPDTVRQGTHRQPNAEVQRRTVTCFQRIIQYISRLINSIFSKTTSAATVDNGALTRQAVQNLRSIGKSKEDDAALGDQQIPKPGTTPGHR